MSRPVRPPAVAEFARAAAATMAARNDRRSIALTAPPMPCGRSWPGTSRTKT